jgi:hypothetical protein
LITAITGLYSRVMCDRICGESYPDAGPDTNRHRFADDVGPRALRGNPEKIRYPSAWAHATELLPGLRDRAIGA